MKANLYTWRARVVSVVDGDSYWVKLDLGMRISVDWEVRLAHWNSKEKNTDAGKAAKAFVETILSPGTEIFVQSTKLEKYGRILAVVQLLDGRDLGKILHEAGHVNAYEGVGPKT